MACPDGVKKYGDFLLQKYAKNWTTVAGNSKFDLFWSGGFRRPHIKKVGSCNLNHNQILLILSLGYFISVAKPQIIIFLKF